MELIVFLIGLCVGSFANVLIDRLPRGQDVIGGRSRCDHCGKTLRWFELVPIASFFIQGGRCRRCHRLLSWQYPLVEAITGVGFVFLFPNIANLLIFFSLLVIFVVDLKEEIIPDSMLIVGLVGGLAKANFGSAFGAAGFFFMLWLITRGRGMGFGDVKLVFFLGLLLGFPTIVVALYIAFLTGATIGVILIVGGKKKLKSHLPFGPFLIFGTLVALLYEKRFFPY